jgi:hypothetical protein
MTARGRVPPKTVTAVWRVLAYRTSRVDRSRLPDLGARRSPPVVGRGVLACPW